MTAAIRDARTRLASARRELAERPRERTVESIAALMDDWCRPGSRWQKRLLEELPAATGFSAENVREGLSRALENWNGDAVRNLVAGELGNIGRGSLATGFDQTSVVLAGSIPMPTIASLIAPLLLHSPVLVKPAARDPLTARVFAESLRELDPELGAAVEVVSFSSDDDAASAAFLDADCVVASGSDETISAIAKHLRAGARFVAYGHRLSVAIVTAEAAPCPEVARGFALDIALWDQLGCLSPVAIYCESAAAAPFASVLAEELASIEERLPRGALPTSAAAAVRRERDEAEMRRAAGGAVQVHADPKLRFTVTREADATWRPAPLHRFVRVHPVAGLNATIAALSEVSRHLAAIGVAGCDAADLTETGASRICAPGRMQTPPLAWHHDGQPVILPLARIVNLEL